MVDATLLFAGELAGLLTRKHHSGLVRYPAARRASIKDVVESLGVPHTEIHGIRANGRDHDFSLLLEPGQEVALLPADLCPAYPVDVTIPTLLRPRPLSALRFLVDENVAGLVPLLRALGFDAAYDRAWDDARIAEVAAREGRVVLSRDRALLKRSVVTCGRLVRAALPDEQLVEVLGLFGVTRAPALFSRCLRCNVKTVAVNKADVLHRLEPKTKKYFSTFKECPMCGRLYWRGSHHARLVERFAGLGIATAAE